MNYSQIHAKPRPKPAKVQIIRQSPVIGALRNIVKLYEVFQASSCLNFQALKKCPKVHTVNATNHGKQTNIFFCPLKLNCGDLWRIFNQLVFQPAVPCRFEPLGLAQDAKRFYLVMELCTGGELFERIVAESVPW